MKCPFCFKDGKGNEKRVFSEGTSYNGFPLETHISFLNKPYYYCSSCSKWFCYWNGIGYQFSEDEWRKCGDESEKDWKKRVNPSLR